MKFLTRKTFDRDVSRLPPEIKAHLKAALKKLEENSASNALRLEKLGGYKNPAVYTIHITSNHSHKLSFEKGEGDTIILRRVDTHKRIDSQP